MDSTMILSLPALVHGFANQTDKRNVGIHEFAHLIDKADGEIDGLPDGMAADEREHWIKLCTHEMTAMLEGHSDINIYGATNRSEFFAVIVEYYKESPEILAKKHPELFKMLDNYFHMVK
jgi:Mlc titration factor MtfA (ptsG expression regulator)